ncbi:MAG: hypothetical protein F2754_14605 [Actinobacteria bacterium]|nr:hypothetical protein [Actinomycetota bacterium]MSX88609.1 hypothetical protein [Actinomycetota bacterium]
MSRIGHVVTTIGLAVRSPSSPSPAVAVLGGDVIETWIVWFRAEPAADELNS